MRLLDRLRVGYEALTYDAGIHSATVVAEALGVPAQRVYKTLVMLAEDRGRKPLLVMIAAPREADMRLIAGAVGAKSVRMAPQRDAERLTGLLVGGIGALALVGRPFDVFIDEPALRHEWILVNGGRRGLNLRLAVADLIRVTGARPIRATVR